MNTGKQLAVSDPATQLDLVARCQKGDKDALGELYRLYRGEVARNLHRMLGPGRADLDDVLQEVFIEVFRSIARFRGDAKVTTWLYRVCVNVALQRLRKRKRRNEVSTDDVAEPAPNDGGETPERSLDNRRRLDAVYRILDELSPKKRVVFILHEIEGREPKEIAGIVGAPVLTVRTRLHYARKEFYALAATDARLDGGPKGPSASDGGAT
ncbi:MAG: polymerase sigma factor RpoE [Myxococcales bacterium]|nr:polymerase sigma factor RpoE [Myxococcales bacterium]